MEWDKEKLLILAEIHRGCPFYEECLGEVSTGPITVAYIQGGKCFLRETKELWEKSVQLSCSECSESRPLPFEVVQMLIIIGEAHIKMYRGLPSSSKNISQLRKEDLFKHDSKRGPPTGCSGSFLYAFFHSFELIPACLKISERRCFEISPSYVSEEVSDEQIYVH
ncbi:MAG: hypothetical protein AAB567_01625 [Patescibacteria group bacterium]